jgi:hypothetical protein
MTSEVRTDSSIFNSLDEVSADVEKHVVLAPR